MRIATLLRTRFLAASTLVVPWVFTPLVVAQVVERNASLGLYGINDAIIIPIGGSVILCLLGAPFLALTLGLVLRRLGRPALGFRALLTWRLPLAVALVAPAFLVALIGFLDWLSWSHVPIAIAYSMPLVWLLWAITVLSRPPQPNPLLQRTATPPAKLER